jgi:preprotein translocase SecE subunit
MSIVQKAIEYLRSAKSEMFKVSWPSRRDTLRYGGLIIGISVATAVLFATLDSGFTWAFDSTILRYAKTSQQAQLQTQEVPQAPITPTVEQTTEQPKAAEPAAIDLQNAKPIETPKK